MTKFRGQSSERQQLLDRTFNGLPLFDADTPLLIVVTEEDAHTAVRGDSTRCLYARGCQRAIQSQSVVFLRTVAYVDVPCTNEEKDAYGTDRKVLRFAIPPKSRRLIENFDSGGMVELGAFRLEAPRGHDALGGIRRASRGKGGHRPKNTRTTDSLTLRGVRNGTGAIHTFAAPGRGGS